MIFNEHLDRLMEVKVVQDFMQVHSMEGKMCNDGENHSFVLYRLPYVIGFWDALIENYLEVVLVDIRADILLTEGSIIGFSVGFGIQNREDLRRIDFSDHPQNDIFLSDEGQKMYGLYTTLEAVDKLLPLIEAKGGLASIKDGSFDSRFNFSDFVRPIYPGLKTRYLTCIGTESTGSSD